MNGNVNIFLKNGVPDLLNLVLVVTQNLTNILYTGISFNFLYTY